MADAIKDIIEGKFKIPRSLDLYKEVMGMSEIERFKQEDDTIRKLVKGDSKDSIIEDLKKKIPDGRFNLNDLNKFIERSDELHDILRIEKGSLARRWLKAKANCMEELAELMFYTKSIIPRMRDEGDHTNELKAIDTMNKLLMNFMELEGHKAPAQVNTQVNVNTNLEQIKQRMRERGQQANFGVKHEIPTDKEHSMENEDTDSP